MFRLTSVLAALLVTSVFLHADAETGGRLTVEQYRAELQQLLAATEKLDSSGEPIPPALRDLPQSWKVHTDQQDFDIPAEGLRRDLQGFEKNRSESTATTIRSRIQSLINDLKGFQAAPPDVSNPRQHLTNLLARPEFSGVRGPTFLERFQRRLVEAILHMLGAVFGTSAVPVISEFLVYGLIGFALLALGFLVFRQLQFVAERENTFVPRNLAVSAKGWALWQAEAHAAAAQHNWREAVHLAYWGGISFLEERGTWRPDRARTPREYLRLLSNDSEHREALMALTRIFELAWYANQEADAASFSRTIEALERLGCHAQ